MTITIQGSTLEEQDLLIMAREANPAFSRILDRVLPEVVERFAAKCLDYKGDAEELGIKAQFVDINRKMGKLRRSFWLGMPLTGEQPDEVAQDMIAHLLLALDMYARRESEPRIIGEGMGEDMLVPGPLATEDMCEDPNCPTYPHAKHETSQP